jgi:HlyD family secretion protein
LNKKIFLPVVMVSAAVVAGAFWYWQSRHAVEDPNQLTLYGNVEIHQVSLAFNASERIAELRVREGDPVRAGEVLGVLDSRTFKLRLAQAQAQIGIQEQALIKLLAGSRVEEIAKARASLAAAEAEVELAKKQLSRLKAVNDASNGRAVSQQDIDNAASRLEVTLAQAESARKSSRLVELGPRKEDIGMAEKQVAAAKAESALVQRQVAETELRAPTDGVVRARLLEPGDLASPQRPVFTLALTRPKWVRAYVTEAYLGRIKPGIKASVTIDSAPGQPIPARLGYISSVAEFTPKTVQTPELRTSLVYEVRLLVDDPQDRLRLGMPATAHLRLEPVTAKANPR